MRCLLWRVPVEYELYSLYKQSVKNITLSNLVSCLSSYKLYPGLADQFAGGCIEHTVPRIFILNKTPSPLFQAKYYRSSSCKVLISEGVEECSACNIVERKEHLSLKTKRSNLISPANLKAPVTLTSPERIKLTLRGLRVENKQEEIVKIREEINNNSLVIIDNLGDDLRNIMSGADKSKITPFMKMFWEEQQKYMSSSKKGVRYHPMIIRYCLGLAAKSPTV